MNCHFVIRSLTQPWEIDTERRLKYFDFSSNKVCEGHSKTLLAEEDINTEKIEGLLNKLIDEPLARFKKGFIKGEDVLKMEYWKTFRALHLYFLFQAPRYAKSNAPKEVQSLLDEALEKGEEHLDQLVGIRMKTYDLRLIKLPEGRVLCFPSTGFFSFPIEDFGCETGFTFSYGVPIFPDTALVLTPKTASKNGLRLLREQLHGFSVGLTDSCEKVILPRAMVEQIAAADIVQMMIQLREAARQVTAATHELRSLVIKMVESVGLKLGPVKKSNEAG